MKTVHVEYFRNDWDFQSAFCEALYGSYGRLDLSCVAEVIACDIGEREGADWIAVVRLDGTSWSQGQLPYCVMRAGCNYTGWDCIASGKVEFYATREEALCRNTLTAEECDRLEVPYEKVGAA